MDDVYLFNEKNKKPQEFKQMKFIVPSFETSFGTIENLMLTKPRCQSKVPAGYVNMKEFDYNTFVYYSVYNGRDTRAKAKQICENQGLVQFTDLWILFKIS